MEKINNVDFIKGDFRENEIYAKIMIYFNSKVDVVLSDAAENTTGNKTLDSYRTGELCINAMNLAKKILARDGIFLSKILFSWKSTIFLKYVEMMVLTSKNTAETL